MSLRPPTLKPANANPRGAASRSWRASLIRSSAQVLGDVEAPSWEAADVMAVQTFDLNSERLSRLVVQGAGKVRPSQSTEL